MENFDDFEKKSYQGGVEIQYGFSDYFAYFSRMFIFFIKIASVMAKEIFEMIFYKTKVKSIHGQLALVTGGANGLGRATSFRLAQEGCNVIIIDINEEEAIQTAAAISEKFNVKTKAYKVDVSNFEAFQELKQNISRDFDGQTIDILINNAGILSAISLHEGQYTQIQKVIDVNMTSHFWGVRTFLQDMIDKKRGHIVGIASMGAKVSFPLAISYCATKSGLDGFYRALQDELCVEDHDEFIKLTCVYPSFINTRKELTDILDQMEGVGPRMSPSYVANEIVEAIKKNKQNLILPTSAWLMMVANFLTPKAMKLAKHQWIPVKRLKKN
ncbi:estradiol 17-beta-dehydrogenase 11-like [Chironomus tepperi]|uniref:estradiol 17-beta-dehydrogenase 11-like n=1 Tax=Chironomus tepperi TaxID=113505 RepID=UPI00391F0606